MQGWFSYIWKPKKQPMPTQKKTSKAPSRQQNTKNGHQTPAIQQVKNSSLKKSSANGNSNGNGSSSNNNSPASSEPLPPRRPPAPMLRRASERTSIGSSMLQSNDISEIKIVIDNQEVKQTNEQSKTPSNNYLNIYFYSDS